MAKAKPYKELLTTALHQRFIKASGIALAFCWVTTILISDESISWRWLPLGFSGVSIISLYISCLCIFIIRLSNLHHGDLITTSTFYAVYHLATSFRVVSTFGWYFLSAQVFGTAYIWAKDEESHLQWIDVGAKNQRSMLNENPIILRTAYTALAVAQMILHLYTDLDQVRLADAETDKAETTLERAVMTQISDGVLPTVKQAIDVTVASVLVLLATYFLLLRHFIWKVTYSLASIFDSSLPRDADPAGIVHAGSFIWQCLTSMFLLGLLWGVSNTIFTIFMSQPPLKKSQPLTSDMIAGSGGNVLSRAVDANGSLINGLSRKKESLRSFALWELYLICTRFESRRKSMFLEVDREGGSSWSQISRQCLNEIDAMVRRVQHFNQMVNGNKSTPQPAAAQLTPAGLPKIASEEARQGDILAKPRSNIAQEITAIARAAGSHPGAIDPVSPMAKRAMKWSTSQIISKEQQDQLTFANAEKRANSYVVQFLQTVPGIPFRDTFARKARAVVFGTPYSAQINVKYAARSLAALLKASLIEDTCGIVARDVPSVIRSLLAAIKTTRQFTESLQPSWTDVDFEPSHRAVPEIQATLGELKSALEAILLTFGEYASSLGMSKMEIRDAKEAVGMNTGQEMTRMHR